MIRHRVQSDKSTDWPRFTCNQPLLYPFLSIPCFVPPHPLPLHIPSSICRAPPTPSNILDPQAYIFISSKVLVCLQFLDSPSVSVADEACFLCLASLYLSGLFLYFLYGFLLFLVTPFDKVLDHVILMK